MDAFVGFSQENVELVEKFANSFGIWMGPESVEVELDGPTNFYRALGVCAKNDFEAKLGVIFESLIPQESEPQG